MNVNITGEVFQIEEVQELGSSGNFKKLDVIVKVDGQYTQYYPLEFHNSNIDKADPLMEGEKFTFTCALRGNLGETQSGTRAFVSLIVWKVQEV